MTLMLFSQCMLIMDLDFFSYSSMSLNIDQMNTLWWSIKFWSFFISMRSNVTVVQHHFTSLDR